MNGKAFLDPARDMAVGPGEAHWRSAAGRAYDAVFQEAHAALERWGIAIPPRESVHSAVRLKFLYAGDAEAKEMGRALEDLARLRNEADYKLAAPGSFRNATEAEATILKAEGLIARLDAIEADATRRAEVIASIRP
jgi:uncharacterized protein (UPF0332 family)